MTITSFPIRFLISFSIFRAVFNVSSMRVPRCSSAVTLMRPLSWSFMKSIPILPVAIGTMERMKIRAAANMVSFLCPKHQRRTFEYQASIEEKTLPMVLSNEKRLPAASRRALSSSSLVIKKGFSFNSLLESMGIRVMAVTVETQTTIVTIHPNSLNMIPAIPGSMVSGTNTATMTRVVAITDVHTSLVAQMAASFRLSPRSRCLEMFSRTTIASSTTIPIATVREASEMMFSELSATSR